MLGAAAFPNLDGTTVTAALSDLESRQVIDGMGFTEPDVGMPTRDKLKGMPTGQGQEERVETDIHCLLSRQMFTSLSHHMLYAPNRRSAESCTGRSGRALIAAT
jgi:hypothetical protein